MNPNTIRALSIAQRDYIGFIETNKQGDLAGWINNMRSRGLAVNTIRQRVSLVRQWLHINENVVLPTRRNRYEGKWLHSDQIQAILAVIPNNPAGRHDFALITAILITGLKVGQVRNWHWGDVGPFDKSACVNRHFPKIIIETVQAIRTPYTVAHFSTMHLSAPGLGEEYIFTATRRRQRVVQSNENLHYRNLKEQPLSPQEINRRIKRYARLAGLDSQGISAEALRHTYKRLGENAIIPLVQDALAKRNTSPVQWKRVERDNRLHGIGRRRCRS